MEGAPQAHTAGTLIDFLECVHPGRRFEIDRQLGETVLIFRFSKVTKQASMEIEALEEKGAKIGCRPDGEFYARITLRTAQ